MKLVELLAAIEKIAADKGLSKPYIVGGLTRDKLMDRIDLINDVDLTTGDGGVVYLAHEVADRLKGYPNFSYEVMKDGHARLTVNDFKIDFSSNFKVPGIESMLAKSGISNPSEMQKELYSRDFTCNAALMTMDLKKIIDPTGLATEDINNKIIKTLLSPELTLGYDNKRIIRVVYLAAKLDFDVDEDIIDWVKKHPQFVANSSLDYLTKKLTKAVEFNPSRVVSLMDEMGLWDHVPLIPELIPHAKSKLTTTAAKKKKKKKRKSKGKKRVDLEVRPHGPLFRNYDYGGPSGGSDVSPGTGMYQGPMKKWKSVQDFLSKSRKRKFRRKAIAEIYNSLTGDAQ